MVHLPCVVDRIWAKTILAMLTTYLLRIWQGRTWLQCVHVWRNCKWHRCSLQGIPAVRIRLHLSTLMPIDCHIIVLAVWLIDEFVELEAKETIANRLPTPQTTWTHNNQLDDDDVRGQGADEPLDRGGAGTRSRWLLDDCIKWGSGFVNDDDSQLPQNDIQPPLRPNCCISERSPVYFTQRDRYARWHCRWETTHGKERRLVQSSTTWCIIKHNELTSDRRSFVVKSYSRSFPIDRYTSIFNYPLELAPVAKLLGGKRPEMGGFCSGRWCGMDGDDKANTIWCGRIESRHE